MAAYGGLQALLGPSSYPHSLAPAGAPCRASQGLLEGPINLPFPTHPTGATPLARRPMKVGATRCQCRGCGLYFNSLGAFDKHRAGTFGKDRRCMTPEEMASKGMATNSKGYWVMEQFTEKVLQRVAA